MSDRWTDPLGGSTVQESTSLQNRRLSTRYALRNARGILSWGEGPECVHTEVDLVNISGGGVALLSEPAPSEGELVRLRLNTDSIAMDALEGRTLAIVDAPSGKKLVRIRFISWVALDAIYGRQFERRLWQRYPAREKQAALTWRANGVERRVRGELLNISGGGAAIILDGEPPSNEPIWFELEAKGIALDPVESTLVGIALDPSGLTIVRLSFVDPCPMVLFEVAVHGSA